MIHSQAGITLDIKPLPRCRPKQVFVHYYYYRLVPIYRAQRAQYNKGLAKKIYKEALAKCYSNQKDSRDKLHELKRKITFIVIIGR